jgi:hypothetical protein
MSQMRGRTDGGDDLPQAAGCQKEQPRADDVVDAVGHARNKIQPGAALPRHERRRHEHLRCSPSPPVLVACISFRLHTLCCYTVSGDSGMVQFVLTYWRVTMVRLSLCRVW